MGVVQLNDYSDSRKQYAHHEADKQPGRYSLGGLARRALGLGRNALAFLALAYSSALAQEPPTTPPQTAPAAAQSEQSKIESPFSRNRFLLYGSLGLEGSSLDSIAALDARYAGFGARAAWTASDFREEVSRERIHQELGRAAFDADLAQLLSIPVRLGIAASSGTFTRTSSATSVTSSPPFTITTTTNVEETQTPLFLGGSASIGLGKGFTLTAAADYANNKTAVDVGVLTDVKNSSDPTGNYQTRTASRIISEAPEMRGQLTLRYQLDDGLSLATIVTADYVRLKNPDRNTDAYRADFELQYLDPAGSSGVGVLAGQEALLSDNVANSGFKNVDLTLTAGTTLTDGLTVAVRGSYRGNFTGKDDAASGSGIMLFGDIKDMLPYILENAQLENLGNIDLIAGLNADMFDDYLRGRNWDLVDAIARQSRLALLADLGAAHVQTLNGKDTQFVGKVTGFLPLSTKFTLTATPYVRYGALVQNEGVMIGGHFNGSPLSIFVDVSQNRTEGRTDKTEAVRMLGGLTYTPKSNDRQKE